MLLVLPWSPSRLGRSAWSIEYSLNQGVGSMYLCLAGPCSLCVRSTLKISWLVCVGLTCDSLFLGRGGPRIEGWKKTDGSWSCLERSESQGARDTGAASAPMGSSTEPRFYGSGHFTDQLLHHVPKGSAYCRWKPVCSAVLEKCMIAFFDLSVPVLEFIFATVRSAVLCLLCTVIQFAFLCRH